jgi:GT2 family glycosyltransferase
MTTSLIICTYMRPGPLKRLLESVMLQSVMPDEILIVDGSTNSATKEILEENSFANLKYLQVSDEDRGLTRQRNFGVQQLSVNTEIVCFLDDDTVLEPAYFEAIFKTFEQNPDAVGVGGVAINENRWKKKTSPEPLNNLLYYELDGYFIRESSRNIIRNILGLSSGLKPAMMPEFSHGKTYAYPLNGKSYEVDLLMGMSMNFRKSLFDGLNFSSYFEGYGLYEDADFCIRARKQGKIIMASAARLHHLHEPDGRPNQYSYGKMVVRNGWYVWRVAYPNPSLTAKLKWHAITLLLTLIRFTNGFTTKKRKAAFTETLGRTMGWWSLFFDPPQYKK